MTQKNAYAAILAGGSGSRMGNAERPKQFLMLGDKPIFIHTIEKIILSQEFDAVLLLCPNIWLQQTRDMVDKYAADFAKDVIIIEGGKTRNDTVDNAIAYVNQHFKTDQDTLLLTHDAVRPFISNRIISDNICAAASHGACDTVIAATDTIVESDNGQTISAIPPRCNYYQGQTPQTFKLKKLEQLTSNLSDSEKDQLTDACKIFTSQGEAVALVPGDSSNIKITIPQDMRIARALMGE